MNALAKTGSVDESNRRIAARIPLGVEVTVRSDHAFWVGLTENLSEGGLFVATGEPLELGDKFYIQLAVAGRQIAAEVEVRWIRPSGRPGLPAGVGVRFLSLDTASEAHLQNWIQENRDDTLFVDFD